MKIKEIEYAISRDLVNYPESVKIMEKRIENISSKKKSELIWFLEHPSIYTAGTSADKKDLLKKNIFPVFKSSRGGEYTYHGPGQRIIYIMLDLRERNYDIRSFVNALENSVMDTLNDLGVKSLLIKGKVGVWIKSSIKNQSEKKISSIGLRVRKGITFHGISINIKPNLDHFNGIISCGNKNNGVTSLKELGIMLPTEKIDEILLKNLKKRFKINTKLTQILS
ncbi:lipoyl(octanoyl) transferase LipB [Hyphomicrobiales bacterium]|jgi:lipoyl(octanoyl) transferase|nr:lipoyl(octanoyl) transferase LipB [Hyphomicrobiales bacterium]